MRLRSRRLDWKWLVKDRPELAELPKQAREHVLQRFVRHESFRIAGMSALRLAPAAGVLVLIGWGGASGLGYVVDLDPELWLAWVYGWVGVAVSWELAVRWGLVPRVAHRSFTRFWTRWGEQAVEDAVEGLDEEDGIADPEDPAGTRTADEESRFRYGVVFGVALPLFCVVVDPVVFVDRLFDDPMLPGLRLAGYLLIAMGILATMFALVRDPASTVLAGVMFGCSLFATAVGILLLPLALPFVLVVIGVFGLIPLFTGRVLWRFGERALSLARGDRVRAALPKTVVVAALTLAVPFGAQHQVLSTAEDSMRAFESGSDAEVAAAVRRLHAVRWWVDAAEVAWRVEGLPPERRQQVLSVYMQETGKSLGRDFPIPWD